MIQAGTTQCDVALRFGVHRDTISSLWRRFQTTGSGSDRPRSGRPRVTSQGQDQYIRVTHLRNRFQTASVTARTIPGLRRIHPRTVRNRLRQHHIRPRRPCVRMVLLPRHRAKRLRWSRAHLTWRLREWEAVLFSDESRFSLDYSWSDYGVPQGGRALPRSMHSTETCVWRWECDGVGWHLSPWQDTPGHYWWQSECTPLPGGGC